MNPTSKAINMILRGDKDKFKNLMEEIIQDRVATLLENFYKETSKSILETIKLDTVLSKVENNTPIKEQIQIPSSFTTKDGIHVVLTEEQIIKITKLYENLNNNSKERLLKLLTESGDAVNRILNLSKIERKSNVK